ncbi:hypothetical protein EC968_008156 [Mortierella alpina]|nr:hypothetical protein EC968_008156 [Mortierella alpina]
MNTSLPKQTCVELQSICYNAIIARGSPFEPTPRMCRTDEDIDIAQLVDAVSKDGVPLVLEGWHEHPAWKKALFTFTFLARHHGKDVITCRDHRSVVDVDITMRDYISTVRRSNFNSVSTQDQSTPGTLLYAKDLSCPQEWQKSLMNDIMPPFITYRGENDLRSSSIWFMIARKDKVKAETLFRSLGRHIELENYFISVDDLAKADFPIYVTEQRIGDLILIPSMGYHQVVNLELVALFRGIVEEDWIDLDGLKEEKWFTLDLDVHMSVFQSPDKAENTTPATCNFCLCDIWNRHVHCRHCTDDEVSYDLCMRCFALGRGCEHRATSMAFMESFSLKSLRELHSLAINAWNRSIVLQGCDGYDTMIDVWNHGIVPGSNNYSAASLAYARSMHVKYQAPVS